MHVVSSHIGFQSNKYMVRVRVHLGSVLIARVYAHAHGLNIYSVSSSDCVTKARDGFCCAALTHGGLTFAQSLEGYGREAQK